MKIIILDFSDATITIMDYDNKIYTDAEDFLEENNFSHNDCQWMITQELKLTIK